MSDAALDPKRQEQARKRYDAAMRDVKYHEREAAAARAKAQRIAETWQLDIPAEQR